MARSPRLPVRWICWLLLAVAPAGCTPAQDSAPSAGTLTIGVLAAKTGPDAGSGSDAARGAQLAIDIVNKKHPDLAIPLAAQPGLPGLAGATLSLATADTGGQAGQVDALTAELVNKEHAIGVVVADRADAVAAAANQIQRLRVPLLDALSSAGYLTDLGMDWYFRTGPSDRSLAETAFGLLAHQSRQEAAARHTVALVTEAGTETAAGSEVIRDLAGRLGYQVVVDQQLTPDGAGEVAAQLAQHPVDAIFAQASTGGAVATVAAIAAQLARPRTVIGLGSGFQQMGQPPASHPPLLRTAAWSAELTQRNPTGRAVMEMYQRRFGRPMTGPAAQAFTATIALAVAIDRAGSPDPAAIRAALRQLWLPATHLIMPWTGIQFDANGQNELAAAVIEGWTGTSFRVVYPRELAVGPMIWAAGGPGR